MRLLRYVILFLLIFDLAMPPVQRIGSAPFALLFCILIICFSRTAINRAAHVISVNFEVFIVYVAIIIYVLIRVAVAEAEEPSFIFSMLKSMLILCASIAYLIAFGEEDLESDILNVFFINAIIALTVGRFNEYQYLVDFFKLPAARELIGYITYRNSFLAGSGYFGIGSIYGLVGAFYIVRISQGKFAGAVTWVKLLVIMLAGIFAARTAFFCYLIATSYLVFVRANVKVLLALFVPFMFVPFLLQTEAFEYAADWVMEIANVFTSRGNQSSVEALVDDHVVFPSDILGLVFGDGKFVEPNGSYYMSTDIGYLRHLFFGGGILVVLSFMALAALAVKNKNATFISVLIPVTLLLHFKGLFLLNNPGGMPALILISYILYRERFESPSRR